MNPLQHCAFFDPATYTLTHVVWDRRSGDAVVIDPVLDFDPITQLKSRASVERLARFVSAKGLIPRYVLETHAHADHLSSAAELKQRWPGALWAMGARMHDVFENFSRVLAWPKGLTLGDLGVDRWLRDGEEFSAGGIRVQAIATPGHTPACTTFRIGEWLFTGDALFLPDSGVGRCDFPGGSAEQLYDSIWRKLYSYSDEHLTFPGHDYQPGGRPIRYVSSLGAQKTGNIHLRTSTSRAEFVRFRQERDKTLSSPRLLQPSLDWNLGAHQLVARD